MAKSLKVSKIVLRRLERNRAEPVGIGWRLEQNRSESGGGCSRVGRNRAAAGAESGTFTKQW